MSPPEPQVEPPFTRMIDMPMQNEGIDAVQSIHFDPGITVSRSLCGIAGGSPVRVKSLLGKYDPPRLFLEQQLRSAEESDQLLEILKRDALRVEVGGGGFVEPRSRLKQILG